MTENTPPAMRSLFIELSRFGVDGPVSRELAPERINLEHRRAPRQDRKLLSFSLVEILRDGAAVVPRGAGIDTLTR